MDDQEPFRRAARLVVDLADGFEVVGEARTGEEALSLAGELAPDLILMDVKMPGMDGVEATARLTEGDAGAAVVVLSTYERADYEQSALDAGAVAFVSKSEFDAEVLLAAWAGRD